MAEAANTPARHTIVTFEAKCGACKRMFGLPSLGDFSYGRFLFYGDAGTAFAMVDAIGHPVWELAKVVWGVESDAIYGAVARVADPVEGQALGTEPICPFCHSPRLLWWEGRKVGTVQVPEATFVALQRLSDSERRELLRGGDGSSG